MRIRGLLSLSLLTLLAAPAAHAQTKVACAGEQSTHSLHRENDPEYPFLMAKLLDADFVAKPDMAPHGGGFVEGGGSHFTIGNFGHPQATVLNHDKEDPKTYLKSPEYQLLVGFKPKIIILGPFGYHEPLTGVPITNFPKDMKTLLDALTALPGKPLVALATPLPESGVDKADAFNQVKMYTEAAAAEYKLPVIDLWQEFLGKTTLYADDFHLKLEGRQHLAEFMADAVEKLDAELKNPTMGGAGGTGGVAGVGGAAAGNGGAAGSGGAGGLAGAGSPAGGGGADSLGAAGMPAPSVGGSSAGANPVGGNGTVPINTAQPPSSNDSSGCSYAGASPINGVSALAALAFGALLLRPRKSSKRS